MPCPVHDCINKALTMPKSALLILAGAIVALAFAFIMQFGFDLHPCVLCLWQRVPYGVAGVLALAAWIRAPYRQQAAFLLALCALVYLTGMGLAFFHSGVEL